MRQLSETLNSLRIICEGDKSVAQIVKQEILSIAKEAKDKNSAETEIDKKIKSSIPKIRKQSEGIDWVKTVGDLVAYREMLLKKMFK